MNINIRKISVIVSSLLVLGMLAPIFIFAADLPVLIVWDSSDFKDELILEIQDATEDAGLVIDLEGSIKFLKNIDPDGYSGIIIVNTGMAGRMKGKVRKLLEESTELPPTVIVTTYGKTKSSKDSDNPQPSVDAISTASLSDANEIRNLALQVLQSLLNL